MPPMKILIVDDDSLIRKSLRRVLRGHNVTEAPSVGDARHILEQDPEVDLILSDVMMPGETGVDFHRWILENRPELASKFAFVTGGTPNIEIQRYIEGCGVPVLDKPFTLDEVKDLVAGFDF